MLAVVIGLLKALPDILRIVTFFTTMVQEKAQQNIGYDKAIKEALEEGHRIMAEADAERVMAEKTHNTDPTDNAFDPDFKRS